MRDMGGGRVEREQITMRRGKEREARGEEVRSTGNGKERDGGERHTTVLVGLGGLDLSGGSGGHDGAG